MHAPHYRTDAEWIAAFHATMAARPSTPVAVRGPAPVHRKWITRPDSKSGSGLGHTKPIPIARSSE